MILQGVEIQIEVELDGQEEAEIVYGALKPEIKSSPSSRTRSWVKIKDKKLILEVEARDSTSLRAAVNSYLRWINLSCQILELS
ncbi:MAG: KEOPS complex subunit Pcc1 [Euryarchaeota archaeon]|nr:KEOPS complex subunit Pcc1 [Euryarchaeota archaeon]HNS25502.1 KEOPS complex subunit Pcc1 [Methanobacteriaceae archaeon]